MTATRPFDPTDRTRVRHSKYGLWDVYEQEERASSVRQMLVQPFTNVRALLQNLRYVYALLDILRAVSGPAITYCASIFLTRVILPTISLWIGGQLLVVLQAAQNGSNFDIGWFAVVVGFDSVSSSFTSYVRGYGYALERQCRQQLRTFFVKHLMHGAFIDYLCREDPFLNKYNLQHALDWIYRLPQIPSLSGNCSPQKVQTVHGVLLTDSCTSSL